MTELICGWSLKGAQRWAVVGFGKGGIGIKLPDLRAQPNAKRGE
jgi:hypothetical protein